MDMYREMIRNPEPDTDPPEDFYVEADCGHEVYEGETLYTWDDETLCPDCMRDKIDEMELYELAALLGCDFTTVERRNRRERF